MAQFIGCWQADETSHTNYDAFAKAAGIPDDMVEKIKTGKSTCEYKRDGDTWSVHITSTFTPDATYTFKSGEEMVTKDPLGHNCKMKYTIISDTEMTEVNSFEMMGWKEEKVTREVKGDKMHVVYEIEGVKMTYVMTRC